jgi:transposase
MIYVGMDVSSKSFMVHAINEKKKVIYRGAIPPTRSALRKLIGLLGNETKLVVFEAGNQMKWIALTLKRMKGVHLHVVHPNEVKWISESSGKTDKVDSRKMAELARGDLLLRAVHVVEGEIRDLRELVGSRHTLQSKRVALINAVRGYMLQEGVRLPEKFFQRADWSERLDKLNVSETTKAIVRSFKVGIAALEDCERELTERIVEIKDRRTELLESIPGYGKMTSRVVLSGLDEAKRFDGSKAAAKYGALTPTIYQSGSVTHLGHINRNGRQEIRRVLLQCAHTVARMKSYEARPLRQFFERVMKKRGKKIAIVALARKLLTIAYGVLKSGAPYDPKMLLPVSSR